ncbi:hypothetical protein BKA66DRAFT_475810 [Pyrenochaeta sp. MPI-SDFR-AT-0127]|nr:hypothetical protein BKA66DRAFT_475810 [Pyrenochaeta sp. MPI-SDFR-AT-0127]
MTWQPKAFVLRICRVCNALASFLAVHSDSASSVALIFEASADVVVVAAVVGPVVAEIVSAVGNDKGRCAAREEKKDSRELHDEVAVGSSIELTLIV